VKVPRKVARLIAERGLSPLARRVRRERLTYLSPERLARIEACLARVREERVPGDVLETGIALGGSAILVASRLEETAGIARRFRGFDVFGRIPPPSERDGADAHGRFAVIARGESKGIGGDDYYGYRADLYDAVVAAFERHGVSVDGERIRLSAGLFEETLRFEDADRVAFAHVDCDWYDPVRLCLERIGGRLSPGGLVLFDDYQDYEGCRRAVGDVLRADGSLELLTDTPTALVRKRDTARP
jgi:asparagine synthase (glutamine-hydrolysing)